MRVVKPVEVRRNELIDCAQALFLTKGYDGTTVADIIARAGVSKGGFYHHFLSKEDLLDALIARMTRQAIAEAEDVLSDPTLDALTKLNRFLDRSQQWKLQSAPALRAIVAVLVKPENALLYQRMIRSAVTAVSPVLSRIVEDGISEGIFDVPDVRLVAELLLTMSFARQEFMAEIFAMIEAGRMEEAVAVLGERIHREEALFDRLLGLPRGSIRLADAKIAAEMLARFF
ncbi:MAG: TetR/AcrR family transcriptional regulator [Alphaproteobacteria bacterium]|nr:TetR/AcrR family transcriptional regulator [Alphaproteobacteria bacterium]MBL7097746.1 TetR/AcrR family transcriptional regulator [Alphaproteobacteria bacterium]